MYSFSSHLSKLESKGDIEVEKKFRGKNPQTLIKLSNKGREAFDLYRKKREQVLSGLDKK